MNRRSIIPLVVLLLLAACQNSPPPASSGEGFVDTFDIDKSRLVPTGTNPYFSLKPGTTRVFKDDDETLTITVLNETRIVDGVTTRIIEEREETPQGLKEVSRNFFAIDPATRDVYYFGEEVDIYKDGVIASHGGAWLAGVNGARFGLIMPGTPRIGDRHYQELAPGEAMDRAEVVSLKARVETPVGVFVNCLYVRETSPLEYGISHKWYAQGVGLVKDGGCVLVAH